jgi:hypothetical protein
MNPNLLLAVAAVGFMTFLRRNREGEERPMEGRTPPPVLLKGSRLPPLIGRGVPRASTLTHDHLGEDRFRTEGQRAGLAKTRKDPDA